MCLWTVSSFESVSVSLPILAHVVSLTPSSSFPCEDVDIHWPVSLSLSGPDLTLPALTCLLQDLQLGAVVSFVCLASLSSGFRWFLLSLYTSYHIYFSSSHRLSFGLIPTGSVSQSVLSHCWSAVNVDRVLLVSVRPGSIVSLPHKDICCVQTLSAVSGRQVPLPVLWFCLNPSTQL